MGTSGGDRRAVRDAVQRAGGYAVLPSPAGEQVRGGGSGRGSNSGGSSSRNADWTHTRSTRHSQSPSRPCAQLHVTRCIRHVRFMAEASMSLPDSVPFRLAVPASTSTPPPPPGRLPPGAADVAGLTRAALRGPVHVHGHRTRGR